MAPVAGTEAGRAELATGAGGDRTVEVDRLAESVAVAALEKVAQAGARFRLLSEEIGERDFGAESPTILLDPIDGSLNATQGLPLYAIMLSLVDEPRVGGVRAGYVMNLATGEAWSAIRGGGAWRAGQRLDPLPRRPSRRFEVLALESSPRSLVKAEALVQRSAKVRILGSMAISIAQAAAGSFDVFCSPIDARVFDMTASLLVLKESGGVATDTLEPELYGLAGLYFTDAAAFREEAARLEKSTATVSSPT